MYLEHLRPEEGDQAVQDAESRDIAVVERRLAEAPEEFDSARAEQASLETDEVRKEAFHSQVPELTPEEKAQRNVLQVSDKLPPSEALEADRVEEAASRLRNIGGLRPENWKTMDERERYWVLEAAGRELGHAYHHGAPPLVDKEMPSESLGAYGDGWYRDPATGELRGSDYGVEIKSELLTQDDPKAALSTYLHEFRHSYQAEQVTAFRKGMAIDAANPPGRLTSWQQSEADYETPPDVSFEEYQEQAIERDSRDFVDAVIKRLYRG